MSMLCSCYRLNETQTESLQANPDLVVDLLGNSSLPPKTGFLSKLFGRNKHVEPVQRLLEPVAASETLDLDQAWHIIHYLLSGSDAEGDWPAAFIMSGGQEVGPDLGYGPARLMSTELSKEVADFLSTQSRPQLDAAYDAQKIEAAQIYWQAASEHTERQGQLDELWGLVQMLRSFFQDTVAVRGSVLVQIY